MLDHLNFLLCVDIRLSISRGVHHFLVVVLMDCQRRIYAPVHSVCRVPEKACATTSQNDCKVKMINCQLLIVGTDITGGMSLPAGMNDSQTIRKPAACAL
jgi:hypothetical protein